MKNNRKLGENSILVQFRRRTRANGTNLLPLGQSYKVFAYTIENDKINHKLN